MKAAADNEIRHLPYDLKTVDPRAAFYEGHWKKVALDLLEKHYEVKGKTILDYGCGRGEAIELFKQHGLEASGADMDPECVRLASQHGAVTELTGAPPDEIFGAKSFDVVACFHVLEHVPEPMRTLQGLGKIARDYLILAVPNLQKTDRIHKRTIQRNIVNNGHLQGWDHWHFLNLAENHCGLELVEWGYDATVLPVVSYWIYRLLGLRAALWMETKLFRWLMPNQGISIIGLFRPKRAPEVPPAAAE